MKESFKIVVSYVKNLFPGYAPVGRSNSMYMDAMLLSKMALGTSYIDVDDKHKYWDCCVKFDDLSVARYIMRSNGLKVSQYYSKSHNSWVLRVRADHVAQDPCRRLFINTVMDKELGILNEDMYKSHLNIVRQRMK